MSRSWDVPIKYSKCDRHKHIKRAGLMSGGKICPACFRVTINYHREKVLRKLFPNIMSKE